MFKPLNLLAAFDRVTDYWSPAVVGRVNDQYLKVAKLKGEFVWHDHADEDELFHIVRGQLRMEFEDGAVELGEGDILTVPKGVRHRPVAEEECWVLLVETATTKHTGDVEHELTKVTRVRPAWAEDVPLLPAIELSAGELFRDTPFAFVADAEPTPVEDHARAQAAGDLWVAVDPADKPVGFLLVSEDAGDLYIDEVSVHAGWQGQGFGRALLDAAVAEARARGLVGVTLTTFRAVPWNAPFYARYGFKALEGERIPSSLAFRIRSQQSRGLDPATRVAMRLALD